MTKHWGPVAPAPHARLTPVPRTQVSLREGVFAWWRQRNREATIPHVVEQLEEAGTIDNIRRLIGQSDAAFTGLPFVDSDIYKTLEGIAWELGSDDDPWLRARYDGMTALLEKAQLEDGYLNSNFQRADREQQPWSDFTHGHELYCLGHLIQAAVAGARAAGDDVLLRIARRQADLVTDLFGGGASPVTCGHPQIETALVELTRYTGDDRYRDLAAAFVDRRGNGFIGDGVFGAQYYQDEQTVRDTTIMRGHAVRAMYLNAGVADVYLETGDRTLLEALETQWRDLEAHRLYITGGTGSRHRDEAFGDAYELPSERAYAETCAGIALIQWGWRMYLATGEAGYVDGIERALYNVVAAGVSADGRAFFYSNPLQRRWDHGLSQQESAGHRLGWFTCACCPPNLVRTFASLDSYLAASRTGELQLALYTGARIDVRAADGSPVSLEIDTDYPAGEQVRVRVVEGSDPDFTIVFRVPAWCRDPHISVDGLGGPAQTRGGWLRLTGAALAGREIVLTLPMTPGYTVPHPRADAIRGSVALTRGPVVYAVEQSDNGGDVDSVSVTAAAQATAEQVTGASTPYGPLLRVGGLLDERRPADIRLYTPADDEEPVTGTETVLTLRPYATWGNNGLDGSMRVWIPRAPHRMAKEETPR